jgi:hypothetical protein
MLNYIAKLKIGKIVLWCYLIWYGVIVYFHFDPSIKLWTNSLGISAVIGTGLLLSVASTNDYWQIFRLYLMPFCVSSFAAHIKGLGFIVFISPVLSETLLAATGCLLFIGVVLSVKWFKRRTQLSRE